MATKKVIVKSLPKQSWRDPSFIIAILAVVATILSLWMTRAQYIESSRPYIWANNFKDISGNEMPHIINIGVYNSPARILLLNYKITGDTSQTILPITYKNKIVYPDAKTEWKVDFDYKIYSYIFGLQDSIKLKLRRFISIEYTSLDGGKKYHYKLIQTYRYEPEQPELGEWLNLFEEAD